MLAFKSSEKYWIERYKRGRDSGKGSYGKFAQFKADIINKFVKVNNIGTVIEFGCGDGNQLTLAKFPSYIGFDISQDAIVRCQKIFKDDPSKSFYLMDEYQGQKADLALSLDVIYHLIEDDVFEKYMRRLFDSARHYVIVYSSNISAYLFSSPHIKHRHFTRWVEENLTGWHLVTYIPNAYSNSSNYGENSNAEFFIYQQNDDAFK
jgi:methyltransferase family protein